MPPTSPFTPCNSDPPSTNPCTPESCLAACFANFVLFRDGMADLAHDDRENTVLNEANVRILSPPRPPPHESEDSELMAAFRKFRVFRVVGQIGRAHV